MRPPWPPRPSQLAARVKLRALPVCSAELNFRPFDVCSRRRESMHACAPRATSLAGVRTGTARHRMFEGPPARQDIHTVKFQTDYPASARLRSTASESGSQIIDRPPGKSGERRRCVVNDVKGFCFFGYFSAPGEFTTHGGDPHFTVPCYCPGRIALALALALAAWPGLGSTPLTASESVAEA